MTKLKFLLSLRDRLSALPQEEVEERLGFYSEMIEDRMEEGLSEEDAVTAVGSVEAIVAQIISETPSAKHARKNQRLKTREILLLVLGSPIWLSLLVAAFAVAITLYVSLWAAIISLWAIFGSVVACACAGIVSGIGFALDGQGLTGIAMIGAGIICAGLSIFLFYGCKGVTNGTLRLTKRMFTSKKEVIK